MSFRGVSRRRVTVMQSDELVTKQSMKAEADINNILTQFKKTGIITHISKQQPIYTDLPDQMDYQQSLHIMMEADEAFATLPSVVRRAFDNDPANLLAALRDPNRREELMDLGIINKPPAPRPPGNPQTILPSQNPPTLRPPPNPSNEGSESLK